MPEVAPLTRGGIIGNIKTEKGNSCRVVGRPSNQGRNHWKLNAFEECSEDVRRRPSNQGRNHWKHRPVEYYRPLIVTECRPSNQGRNHWKLLTVRALVPNANGRPSNQGRNHWKPV